MIKPHAIDISSAERKSIPSRQSISAHQINLNFRKINGIYRSDQKFDLKNRIELVEYAKSHGLAN